MNPTELLPTQSVYVSEYYPRQNYLSQKGTLFWGRFRRENDRYRSLLKFTLDDVSKAFDKAYLQLNISRNEIQQGTRQIGFYRILDDWDPAVISWDSLPRMAAVPEITLAIPTGWLGLMIVDVTQLVGYWLAHHYVNHGVLIIGDEAGSSLVAVQDDIGNPGSVLLITS